jgi:hypothetical protein
VRSLDVVASNAFLEHAIAVFRAYDINRDNYVQFNEAVVLGSRVCSFVVFDIGYLRPIISHIARSTPIFIAPPILYCLNTHNNTVIVGI